MTKSPAPPAEGHLLPDLKTDVPGPASRALAKRLARVESPNITCLHPKAPIFWQRALGANVWDVDGNRYLDMTAAFGVANAGHAHPDILTAIANQSDQLLHGMGDVHPSRVKVELLESLAAIFPGGGSVQSILGSSGSDAVEAAIKTAQLATGHPGLLAFEGGYHGLSLGVLDATSGAEFRDPFSARLPHATRFARYGDLAHVRQSADQAGERIGAILVEPIQGRGGIRMAPPGFLADLRSLCNDRGWLLICDEIYTGFGRTGRWFACEHEGVVPDLLCVGKGLSSGMPISACIGSEAVMAAWPVSQGEAIHTQTFLGHPASCAAALASMRVLEREERVEAADRLGQLALERLRKAWGGDERIREIRGLGLLIGIECHLPELAREIVERALQRGVILLASGTRGEVISLTPPLSIDEGALLYALDELIACMGESQPAGDPLRGNP